MASEHPFPGRPQEAISAIAKPKTSPTTPQTGLASPSPIPCPKKFIVVDYDGSNTWFGAYEPAMEWFMASHLASRIYLLCNGAKTLLAGLPTHTKPFKQFTPPKPLRSPQKLTQILVWDAKGTWLGSSVCNPLESAWWKFYPAVPNHKPGIKLRRTWQEAIPAWAKPLITEWVLID